MLNPPSLLKRRMVQASEEVFVGAGTYGWRCNPSLFNSLSLPDTYLWLSVHVVFKGSWCKPSSLVCVNVPL